MNVLESVRGMIASSPSQQQQSLKEEDDSSSSSNSNNSNRSNNNNKELETLSADKKTETKEGESIDINENYIIQSPTKNRKHTQQPPPSTSWLFRSQSRFNSDSLLNEQQQQHEREDNTDKASAFRTASSLYSDTNTENHNTKEWIDKWTASGLSNYVSLPMICVLGDTSSGKSSVLSSLLGLELPSASTLTTKCPVLVQMKRVSSNHNNNSKPPGARAKVGIQWHKRVHGLRESPRKHKRSIEQKMARIEKQVEEMKTKAQHQHGHGHGQQHQQQQQQTTIQQQTLQESNHPHHHPAEDTETSQHNASRTTIINTTPLKAPASPPTWTPRTLFENLETTLPQTISEAQTFVLDYRKTLVAPDTICVTLESPDCQEELTLVDLPGLVHFQHDQDSSLLGQVERVVLEYIRNPRSILLPIVAAPTNIHNSRVLQWALEFDPNTTRTIPVLTKPDLVDPGSEPQVLELLQTDRDHDDYAQTQTGSQNQNSPQQPRFRHGFYMVKNRGQALLDQGASIEDGLAEEIEYFQSTLPWNALTEPCLGISNLRTKLAKVLWQAMEESLPNILQDVRQQKDTVQTKLESMGTMYTTRLEQRKFYHNLSQNLVARVRTELSGKGRFHGTFRAATAASSSGSSSSSRGRKTETAAPRGASLLHQACNEFYTDIQRGGLANIKKLVEGASVLVSVPGLTEDDDIRGELVYIDWKEGYACCDYRDAINHTTDVLFDGIGHACEQPDFEANDVWSENGSRVCIGRAGGLFDSMRKLPLKRIRTDPSWLQDKIRQFRTDDMACFVNVEMFQHVVAEFVRDDWAPPCHKMLKTLQEILESTLEDAIQETLPVDDERSSRFALLKRLVQGTCRTISQTMLADATKQVQEHLKIEEEYQYTQDEVLLKAISDVRYDNLKRDLELQLRLDQEGVVFDTHAIQSMLDGVFRKHQRQNWMAEQMEVVLSCYGKVATQRVLDRTPQICWQVARNLPEVLLGELGCVTDSVLEKCLWESPQTLRQYEELQAQLKGLKNALDMVGAS